MGENDTIQRSSRTIWTMIADAPMWLAAAVLFFLMAMTFLDVLSRSIFNNPIESATELTRLFMAIMVFAALPMVTWKGEHIVVDLMDPLFSRRLARVRDVVIDLVCGAVILWPAKRVFDLAERARDYGDKTEYLGLPQFYIGWFIAAFAFLTAFVFLARGLTLIFAPHRIPRKGTLE